MLIKLFSHSIAEVDTPHILVKRDFQVTGVLCRKPRNESTFFKHQSMATLSLHAKRCIVYFYPFFRPLYADRLKMEVNYETGPPENNRKGTKNLLPQQSRKNISVLWIAPRGLKLVLRFRFCVDLIGSAGVENE